MNERETTRENEEIFSKALRATWIPGSHQEHIFLMLEQQKLMTTTSPLPKAKNTRMKMVRFDIKNTKYIYIKKILKVS